MKNNHSCDSLGKLLPDGLDLTPHGRLSEPNYSLFNLEQSIEQLIRLQIKYKIKKI